MVGGPLAANADVLALFAAGLNRHRQHRLDRRIALIEQMCDQTRVPVQAQRELRHVVGADGEAIEVLQELLGQHGIRGQFTHHD